MMEKMLLMLHVMELRDGMELFTGFGNRFSASVQKHQIFGLRTILVKNQNFWSKFETLGQK